MPLALLQVISFIIGEAIPFFNDLLSLISSVGSSSSPSPNASTQLSSPSRSCSTPGSATSSGPSHTLRSTGTTRTVVAGPKLNTASTSVSLLRRSGFGADTDPRSTVILLTGAFFFVAGTYASIQSILNSCTYSSQPSRVLPSTSLASAHPSPSRLLTSFLLYRCRRCHQGSLPVHQVCLLPLGFVYSHSC
jgi:hypothetical protein